jgi:hypothetical protein
MRRPYASSSVCFSTAASLVKNAARFGVLTWNKCLKMAIKQCKRVDCRYKVIEVGAFEKKAFSRFQSTTYANTLLNFLFFMAEVD